MAFIYSLQSLIVLIDPPQVQAALATGGTYSESGGYGIHTFTSGGTFTPSSSFDVEVLVVAGGGGGAVGGGGGAGGYRTDTSHSVTAQDYTITVGAGGAGSSWATQGIQGSDSIFDTITSSGGGGGGANTAGDTRLGGAGGSGGGGGACGCSTTGGAGNTPNTSPSQGNSGGNNNTGAPTYPSGGGGGATGAGGNATAGVAGAGGAGTSNSISGSPVTYSTGGAGALHNSGGNGSAGAANTGDGGEGGQFANTGGAGGSGIVIIRYLLPTAPTAPTIGSSGALTTTSLRWNFTDNADDETGFKVYDNGGTPALKVTCATANLTYCDETSLSVNTQYTRKVVAYNDVGNSSYSSTASKYTLATTPAAPTVNGAAATTLDVNPDPNTSPTSTEMVVYKETGASCDGSGGSYVAANGSDNSSTPVWQAESSWGTVTATGLSEQTQYSFCTKSRNGDNTETSWGSAASGTTIEATAPSISSINSVAGDASATYYDATDNSSTAIAFTSTDGSGGGVDNCKWDTSDVAYDSMSNSCGSTSSCTTNLSGDGAKTVYIRCQDIYSNKMSSSQTVNYTIDSTAPSTLSATGSSASWTNAKPTVAISTPADALSGMNEIRYVWNTNNLGADCSAGTVTTATANLTGTLIAGSHILYLCASDNVGNVATWNGTYKWDDGNPLVNMTTHALTAYRAANIPAKIQGTASDALSSVASVAVSIYNGVKYYSGATFDSVSQVWLAATGTDTWEYTFAPSSDGDYTLQSRSTDGATNTITSSTSTFTYDTVAPTISTSEDNTPGSAGATITWSTDEVSSSQLEYGVSSSYGTTTAEINTSTRVTSHSVELSNLQSCSTYHYRSISKDAAGNTLTGEDKTFTTTSCTGSSIVGTQVEETVTTASGGTVELEEGGSTQVALTIPPNFSGSDADFQVKKLNKDSVLLATSTPTSVKEAIGDHVYQLDALTSPTERVSSFDQAITITMNYTDAQIVGYDESTLVIYRWDGSSWYELDDCIVDTDANTISCTTSAFSTFVLFGEEEAAAIAAAGSSDGGVDNQACSGLAPSNKAPKIYGAIPLTPTSIQLYFTDADWPVKNYVLAYGTDPGNYQYGWQNIGAFGQRTFIVDNLQSETDYYFRIMAINECYQPGPWSNEAKGSTSYRTKTLSLDNFQIFAQELSPDIEQQEVSEVEDGEGSQAGSVEKEYDQVEKSWISILKEIWQKFLNLFRKEKF